MHRQVLHTNMHTYIHNGTNIHKYFYTSKHTYQVQYLWHPLVRQSYRPHCTVTCKYGMHAALFCFDLSYTPFICCPLGTSNDTRDWVDPHHTHATPPSSGTCLKVFVGSGKSPAPLTDSRRFSLTGTASHARCLFPCFVYARAWLEKPNRWILGSRLLRSTCKLNCRAGTTWQLIAPQHVRSSAGRRILLLR